MTSIMSGLEAAEAAQITYHKLDYWVRQGVITPTKPGTRGRDRKFTQRDVSLLQLAGLLREHKFPLDAIKFSIECLDHWKWNGIDQITAWFSASSKKRGVASPGGMFRFEFKEGWTDYHDWGARPIGKLQHALIDESHPKWHFFAATNYEPSP